MHLFVFCSSVPPAAPTHPGKRTNRIVGLRGGKGRAKGENGQRATYFDLVQYTSKQYRPSRSPTTRTDVPARLPGVSPTHPGHTCQRASPHDAHVVTGRTHHLSSPLWSSLRRRQLCCCCSWTSWRSSDGLVRDGGLRRRYEDDIVTAAELIPGSSSQRCLPCQHAPCAVRLACDP